MSERIKTQRSSVSEEVLRIERQDWVRDIREKYILLRPSLPVTSYEKQIIESVENNDVVIIKSTLGSGKSTEIPKYLSSLGQKVIVTQPRTLAAVSISEYVAATMDVELGKKVGYSVGRDKNFSKDTEILYCTDGIHVIHELLTGKYKNDPIILVIDEVHEWNENIEILIAWIKRERKLGRKVKLVLMSATISTEKLEEFFSQDGLSTTSINIKESRYKVERTQRKSHELQSVIIEKLNENKNVLVFLPGKKEIHKMTQVVEKAGLDVEILPLYRGLSHEEKSRIFATYSRPKVIFATNLAQTSLTVDDMDVVISSGKARHMQTNFLGVDVLQLYNVSKVELDQQAGRVGRVKPGEAILCSDISFDERDEYSIPDIHRKNYYQSVLRMRSIGMDINDLDFFHPLKSEKVTQSLSLLTDLGALDKEGKITDIGKEMLRLPLDVRLARMVSEGKKRGCLRNMLLAVSIMQVGGIKKQMNWKDIELGKFSMKNAFSRVAYRVLLGLQYWNSDLLHEMELYNIGKEKQRSFLVELGEPPFPRGYSRKGLYFGDLEREFIGIDNKKFREAQDIYFQLIKLYKKKEGIHVRDYSSNDSMESVLKCFLSGMPDHVYKMNIRKQTKENPLSRIAEFQRENDNSRLLHRDSVLNLSKRMFFVAGFPVNIHPDNSNRADYSLCMSSVIEEEWLHDMFPDKYDTQNKKIGVDDQEEITPFSVVKMLRGDPIYPDEVYTYYVKLFDQVEARTNGKISERPTELLIEQIGKVLESKNIFSVQEFNRALRSGILSIADVQVSLESLYGRELISKLNYQTPVSFEYNGQVFPIEYGKNNHGYYIFIIISSEQNIQYLQDKEIRKSIPSLNKNSPVFFQLHSHKAETVVFSDLNALKLEMKNSK